MQFIKRLITAAGNRFGLTGIPTPAGTSSTPVGDPHSDPYPDRLIFHYWDGSRDRAIDPLVAWRELNAHPQFSFETTPAEVDAGDLNAAKIAVDAVREVFGIEPYSGLTATSDIPATPAGLTEWETLALLQRFAVYLADLKKSTDQPPTLQDATERKRLEREFLTGTKPSSDSGSTSSEPKPVEPAVC